MRTAAARKPAIAEKFSSFPAPVGGWIANVNLATPGARRPDGSKVNGAAMLENWFPTATGIRMRRGSQLYQQLAGGAADITSLFSYRNGNNRKLFATTATDLYDITIVVANQYLVDDDGNRLVDDEGNYLYVEGNPPSVESLTGGDWSVVQFATSGGVFLRGVNGLDTPLVFDGTDWGTSPAITGPDPTTLSYVWAFKRRLFFLKKDSLDAYYLPVDSIGGAATLLPLGGVFSKGGSLVFGSSWSLDSGSGLTEQCAFFTSEGEVAVYQGSDPGDASAWSLVGVYQIGKPRGPKAFIRAGGDIVVATDIGFVPLSQAVQRDIAALSSSAVSYPIEVAWNAAVEDRTGNWHCVVWPTKQMVIVAPSIATGERAELFVANARTGAWAPFAGWTVKCMEVFGDRLFFGSTEGKVVEAEVTGADQGETYTAVAVPLFDPLKSPASLKSGLQSRITYRAPSELEVKLSLQKDYVISLPTPPNDIAVSNQALWGTGIWGSSVWGGESEKFTFQKWKSTPGSGYALAVAVQVTSGSIAPPDVEIVQTDLTYEQGEIGS